MIAALLGFGGILLLVYCYVTGLFAVSAFNLCPEEIRRRHGPVTRIFAAIYIGAKWPKLIYLSLKKRAQNGNVGS